MNGAELKEILRDGGRVFGTMITIGRSPRWVPVLDGVGLDYAVIDTEHNPRSRGELGDYLAMFNTGGVVPIVRIPIPDSHYVTMVMDAGAQGVLAPYCETVDEAREVVAAAKWRPLKGEAVDRLVASGEHVSDATPAPTWKRATKTASPSSASRAWPRSTTWSASWKFGHRRHLRRPQRHEHLSGHSPTSTTARSTRTRSST